MYKASVETVTPEMAAAWLARNPKNRHLRQTDVDRLAEDMRNGHFVYNGESVILDDNGNLLDGQHRLSAVVQSRIPQKMLVARGIPRSRMRTIDRGVARSVGDWLKIQGFTNYTILAGAARMLHIFEQGALQRSAATGKFHPSDADSILDRHPGLTESVSFAMAHREGMKRVYRSDGSVAFLHYIFTHVDEDKGNAFIEGLASGVNLEPGSPVLQLRDRLTDDLVDTRKKLTPSARLAFILKAWRYFLYGRTVKRLTYTADESFPSVAGFTYKVGKPVF